ncbi:MAG: hypothetical protein ACJ788_05610 [Ktedonobacteraceae bacterium]
MNEQQQQQPPPKRKPSREDLATIAAAWPQLIRARKDPKAFEQVVDQLAQKINIPVQDIPVVKNAFTAVRDAGEEKQTNFVDRYLVGGIGVVDLILLQVLLTAGAPDAPLTVALLALICSLPLTAMSLYFSFLKQRYSIPTYGKIHGNLSFFALLTGTISLDAAFWHVSRLDGIVFLCLAVAMYLWAGSYLAIIQASFRFIDLQKPPEPEQKEEK